VWIVSDSARSPTYFSAIFPQSPTNQVEAEWQFRCLYQAAHDLHWDRLATHFKEEREMNAEDHQSCVADTLDPKADGPLMSGSG
jgi:hypothetical protein